MKKTITKSEFCAAFIKYNRANNFTYEGREALYDDIIALEEDTGEEIELDVISLCCEFAEYANLAEFQQDYGDEYQSLEDIRDETHVIEVDDESFIIQCF